MKRFLLLFLFLLLFASERIPAWAQDRRFKDVRQTYLWDVTLSMKGYNGAPDIYQTVVEALTEDIRRIANERTEIVVVPFQDDAYCDIWRVQATEAGKKELIGRIRAYDNDTVTNTNIALPLRYAIEHLFTPDKIDILKLMTDGKTQDSQELNKVLSGWCSVAERLDVYGYYIILTSAARDEALVTYLNAVCRFETITGTNIQDIVSILPPERVAMNVRDDYAKPLSIRLTVNDGAKMPGDYTVRVCADENPYFDLDETVTVGQDNILKVTPRFKMAQTDLIAALPLAPAEQVHLSIEPSSDKFPLTRILDKSCLLELINKPEKTLRFHVE